MTENMKNFLEAVSKDTALKEKVDTAQTVAELIELAGTLGVELTEEDFGKKEDGELSEDELAAVSGGSGFCLLIGASDTGCGCVLMGLACYYDLVCVAVGV